MNEDPEYGVSFDVACLRIADLVLQLDARDSGIELLIPECHKPFLVSTPPEKKLTLHVRQGTPFVPENWRCLFVDKETWQLWEDPAGRYIFISPVHSPPVRQLTVDHTFSVGGVIGEFESNHSLDKFIYPLRNLDLRFFVNWMAKFGDFILHASGISYQGEGFVFFGHSGVGKSTMATELAAVPGVKVLGEDQVIVRRQKNRYMVYGTPWHINPARCAPDGVPLKKLFALTQAGVHSVGPLGKMSGIERLLQNAFIPYYNRSGVEHILETLSHLAGEVPFFTLSFQIGADVMALVKSA